MATSKAELFFLEAAAELTSRQRELLPLLERALGHAAFDYWILGEGRGDPSVAAIETTTDGQWRFRFHGLEVDVRHTLDGRAVRIDFGPRGMPAFTPGGVGEFTLASVPPWRAFPDLRAVLAGSVGYDHARCVALADELRYQGLIDYVAPDKVALVARYGRLDPKGAHVLDMPEELWPEDESTLILGDRLVVTDKGRALLARAG
jgi:hypothetical protein